MPINDSLNTATCSVDMQFLISASGEQVLHVNSAIHALLGYATKEFFETDLRFAKLIHTADQNIAEELFSLVAQEIPKNINFRCRQQNGKIICLQGRYHKKYDQNSALILHLQLTDAKLLKQNLSDSILLSNFTAMMENSEDYIFFKDRNHAFTAASQTLVSITDPSEHWTDLIGKTDYDVFQEEYADAYYQLEKEIFAGSPSVQDIQKIQDKQGNIGWVDNRKYPILDKQGKIIGLFGIARDITENILNQQKVQQLLSKQKVILENNLIGSATVKDRKILWTNPAYTKLFGYRKSELIAMPTRQLYADEETYQLVGHAYKNIAKEPVRLNELKFLHKNGQLIWVNLGGTLIDVQEDISLWSFVDVSELKQSRLTLQNSETRFRTLFESHGDAIMLLGDAGLFNCNKATLEMFGCTTVEEFCALKDPAYLSPAVQPCGTKSSELGKQLIATALEKGHLSFEWTHKRHDNGWVFPAEVLLTTMFLDGQQVIQGTVRDISKRKQIESALRESDARWKFALEGAGDGVWEYDFVTHSNTVSKQLALMLGIDSHISEGYQPLDYWADLLHPDSYTKTLNAIQVVANNKSDYYLVEHQVRHRDGHYKWILSRGKLISRTNDGQPLRMIGISIDITERKQTEHDLRIAAAAFESKEGVIVTDNKGTILKVNHAFSQITGYSAAEAVGCNPSILQSGHHNESFYASLWQSLENTGVWDGEIWNKRKNGDIYPEYLNISAVKGQTGTITNYVASFHDITQEKAATAEIERLAFYDPLTNLPNRRLLLDRLDPALAASSRSGRLGALLFIDLDNFKTLNDTHGHDIGDLLLQQVATRLLHCIREGDTVARLGGDEFVVMLEDLSEHELETANLTKIIGNKIITTLNQPYLLGGLTHYSTPSIGATLFNGHKQTTDELLKYADIAMYEAKASGRNALRFFDQQMQSSIIKRALLEEQLYQALRENQFEMHYQAQVHNDRTTIGAEALIRWRHPQRGLLAPSAFMNTAEETGIIINIGYWVLKETCRQLKRWENTLDKQNLQISVNISSYQFRQTDFVSQVTQALSYSNINPSRLRLEITEQLVVHDLDDAIIKMHQLRKIGVHFAIGNFGIGYSSLSSLKKLPIDQIKLDQSFVHDIANAPDNDIIVQTIITMAKNLNIELIAEGVETELQRDFLALHGCLIYQGYLFAKPVPMEEFESNLMTV